MKLLYQLLFILLFISFFSISSKADKRNYVWTYQYQTLNRGLWELEYYNTSSSPLLRQMKGNTTSEHQIELEVGMTDRFDIGLYQVFTQEPGASLKYEEFKIRARYRLFEKNEFFVDPLIYLEYIGVADFSKSEIEAKLILSKSFGKFNFTLNPIAEFEFTNATKFTPAFSFGASYAFSELFSLGFEAKGQSSGYYIGPTLSHGNDNMWIALSPLFAVGNVETGKPEILIRIITGFGK